MANVIPDTGSIEVAKIAAAPYLMGTPGSDLDRHLKEFAKAYKAISETVDKPGKTDASLASK